MSTTLSTRGTFAAVAAAVTAVVALAGAKPAPGDVVNPALTLGPTTVLNGVAAVSGTLGAPSSGATLAINGQPISVTSDGRFTAAVNLNGQSNLSLAVRNPLTGEVSTTSIPLTTNIVGPGGVISPDVLAALERAAVSITKPLEGFQILDGKPISIGGSILNRDELASLRINGVDVLSLLRPDGTFVVPIPGTSKEVSVTSTDRQGVSHTTVYPLASLSTVIATPSGRSISAAGALGIRIASVRYITKRIKKVKRLSMIVTIKDQRGYLVRGATVSIRSLKAGRVANRPKAKQSGKLGRVGFVLRLRKNAFGKRLFVLTMAKTPSAKASKRTSVRLPRLARSRAARR